MKRIRLTICYFGDNYCGWQVQDNLPTVQSAMQDALEKLYGIRPPVIGCSRTDSKVHAKRYVCCFDIPEEKNTIPVERIPFALSSVLPYDIACLCAKEVDLDFHPRYSCIGKEYKYLIYNAPIPDPFFHNRAWHCKKELDLGSMQEAVPYIVGKKDFRAFMASGSSVTDTVRDVKSLEISKENSLITVTVSADGFLYNMVRIIAGTLCECGKGSVRPEYLKEIIKSADRKNAGVTAPPHGLYLNRIFYEKEEIL